MAKQARVGFDLPPGSWATWVTGRGGSRVLGSYLINLDAPFGGDGATDPFRDRYRGGEPDTNPGWEAPQGMSNELHGINIAALEQWFLRQPAEHRALYTGSPTDQEAYDLAFTIGKRDAFYFQYHWNLREGADQNAPIVVTEANYREHEGGVWDATTLGLHGSSNAFGAVLWYDVQWLPGHVVPAPPTLPPLPPPPPALPKITDRIKTDLATWTGLSGLVNVGLGRQAALGRIADWVLANAKNPPTGVLVDLMNLSKIKGAGVSFGPGRRAAAARVSQYVYTVGDPS